MKISELKKELRAGRLRHLYLFYGEEEFLINRYLGEVKTLAGEADCDIFSDKHADAAAFVGAAESYPMSGRRLVIARNTEFLRTAANVARIADVLRNPPPYTICIFIQDSFKPNKEAVNLINKDGAVVEFARQSTGTLCSWVNMELSAAGKRMAVEDIQYLVAACGNSMRVIEGEMQKLKHYAGADVITRADVDTLLPPSEEYKLFRFGDMVMSGNYEGCFAMLKDFALHKQSATSVNHAVYNHLSELLMFKLLPDAARRLAPNRQFLAGRLYSAAKAADYGMLRRCMNMCAEFDVAVKKGEAEGSLEMLTLRLLAEI